MIRKLIICITVALMAAVPLASVLAADASAATSRVAIIKEMKGTVTVKKAGGSKEFKAFTRMSLNQGDILETGANSSAVLQFANGSSEDDKMTVTASTTLTFSKLNNAHGTSTKVSMFNGSAWVDVKSITTKDDEFTLETPTAIMGVRGTHLLVSVDPDTGNTRLTVAAGVVTAASTGAGSGEQQQVHPTQNALFTESEDGSSEITVAPVDLELLMSQSDADIVGAILESAAAIVLENQQYVEKYEQEGILAELGVSADDLARFKSNTENLLGGIADQAVKSGLLSQERLDQIITEVKNQSGIVVDPKKNALTLTDAEKQRKEEQRKKEEAAKNQAEARKQQAEADRKASELLLKQLEAARKAKEEANRKEAEEKKKSSVEKYESQLPDAEKARFDENKKNREAEAAAAASAAASPTPTPTSTPTPPPVKSSNADLASLSVFYTGPQQTEMPVQLVPVSESGAAYYVAIPLPVFDPSVLAYTATVPNTVSQLKFKPVAADANIAGVKVNGQSLSDGTAVVQIGTAGNSTTVPIVVTAEDGSTKTYTVNVQRQPCLIGADEIVVEGLGLNEFNPDVFNYNLAPFDNQNHSLLIDFNAASGGLTIDVTVQSAGKNPASVAPAAGDIYDVPLAGGTNVISVTLAKTGQAAKTYTFTVERLLSSNANLADLVVTYLDSQGHEVNVPVGAPTNDYRYIVEVPMYVEQLNVTTFAEDSKNAKVSFGGGLRVSGDPVILNLFDPGHVTNTYIYVIAEDGTEGIHYSLTIKRPASLVAADEVAVGGLTAFDPSIFNYSLNMTSDTNTIEMSFGNASSDFQVEVQSASVGNGLFPQPGQAFEVPLIPGDNEITVILRYDQEYFNTYTFTVNRELSAAKAITSFAVTDGQQTVTGTVYEADKTILLVVPYGTDLSTLTISSVTISEGASIYQKSPGSPPDFNSPVVYTVTAENGADSQDYTVIAVVEGKNIVLNTNGQGFPNATESYKAGTDGAWNAVNGTHLFDPDAHDRWANWGSPNAKDWVAFDFGSTKVMNRVDLYLYSDGQPGGTLAPAGYQIQYSNDGEHWTDVSNPAYSPVTPAALVYPTATEGSNLNTVIFDKVIASHLRVVFTNGAAAVGAVEIEVYYGTPNVSGN